MKQSLRHIKSFIFDMDGVITNTMPYHYLAWKKAFSEVGIKVNKLDVYLREGQTGTRALKEIFDIYKKRYSRDAAYSLLKKKETIFKKIVKTKYIPGARTFIRHLAKNNFLLGLVTGTSRPELKKILPEYLIEFFSVVVTSSEVQNGKPHPEPYLKALKAIKTSASEAIVIENAPLGILSAKRAGIKCFALETSLNRDYLLQADESFPSFKELEFFLGVSV